MQKGDEKAFEQIFYLYKDKLYGFCFRLLACEETSKEIVQETMVRLWEKRRGIAVDRSLNAYLYMIARNLVRDHINRYAREAEISSKTLSIESEAADVIEQMSYREIKKIEENVVSQLPPQQKEVYQLSRYDQLSNLEIADNMGISVNSVKTHLRLALKTMREHLAPVTNTLVIVIAVLMKG